MRIKGIISGMECGEITELPSNPVTQLLIDISNDGQRVLQMIFENATYLDTIVPLDTNRKDIRLGWIRRQCTNKGWSNYRTTKTFKEIRTTLQGAI